MLKTLIFNGSPRKNGDTVALLDALTNVLEGEYRIVRCYNADISPCIDCRACVKSFVCSLKDEMQEIYRYIGECDNVVIASPLYFSEVTGKLLDVASRFQIYYSARAFRHEIPDIRAKRGGIILVGGGDGKPDKAYSTSVTLLRQINTPEIFPLICSHSTNILPASQDREAVSGVRRLADFLNRRI